MRFDVNLKERQVLNYYPHFKNETHMTGCAGHPR